MGKGCGCGKKAVTVKPKVNSTTNKITTTVKTKS